MSIAGHSKDVFAKESSYTIELATLGDGEIFISVSGTVLKDAKTCASEKLVRRIVPSIDVALQIIKATVTS